MSGARVLPPPSRSEVPVLLTATFWFLMALVIAAVEIESEGKYGWAEKAPTWFRKTGFAARLYGLAMGGKPLTGYHTFMFFLPVLIFHSGFFMGAPWSWRAELAAWAMYFAWCPLWDYLWFLLNPAYGFKRFRKENVWWHAKSDWVLGRFPADYLVGWGISIPLAFAAGRLGNHIELLGWFLAMTALTIFFVGPAYARWRTKMLAPERDERHLAGIFHNDEIRKDPRRGVM
jgi:hypothetical protein